jgi:heme/copper-type cytochrome/quinol oxidase subunit 2
MDIAFPDRLVAWWGRVPVHSRVLLGLAISMTLVELAFRRLAPRSAAYARWTEVLKAIGAFWTAIILSVIYFLSVSVVSVFLKLRGQDPLDRKLDPEPSFWRPHDPNPLGPVAAARHQF